MTQLCFSPETTYVALAATILPPGLRPKASCAGLCHFQVVDHALDAERYFVRVAALPSRLNDLASERVFTLCLSVEQIAQALPWERALQTMATWDVREQVEAHIKRAGGMVPQSEPKPLPSSPAPEEVTLVPTPEMFVSCQTIEDVLHDTEVPREGATRHRQRFWLQQFWLRAVLAMVRRQMSHVNPLWQATLHLYLKALDVVTRRVFIACRRTHQPLVYARPAYCEDRQVGWYVRIGVPVTLVA